ncbi:MAG: sulfatase [Sphingomonadales bacterium]
MSALTVTLRAAALTACALVSTPAWAKTPAKPVNMVFILVDDLRYDAMGFLKPGLQTPNIDRLAREGVHFPNAVVTSALCSPSRATILTGRSSRNHGVIDNNNSTEKGLEFFPAYLQQAGYQTAFLGKWHMGDDTDAPRPGFDKWVSFKGQGTYFPTDYLTPEEKAAGKVRMLNVDGKAVPQRGYITDELTDYAIDWLDNGRDKDKPFFLYLSHKAVHAETFPPPRYASQYADLEIGLPASMADTPENNRGKPMWVRNERNSWHGVDFPYHTDASIKEMIRDYYRTLTPVDDSVGRILKYLKDNGLEQNTLIVFYSDNGFIFGEHGLIDKRNAYEPSIRVPMIAWAPGLLPRGVTNRALVRNLDLAPTFLDCGDVAKPEQMEGESLLPLAKGSVDEADWKPGDFVYEYYWEWTFPTTPTTFAIQRNRLKYIQYHGVWDLEELYDLDADPEEMNNLIDDPAYRDRKLVLRHALFEQLANTQGKHVVPFTERTSLGAVYRSPTGAKAADFPPQWLVEPNRPDADRYRIIMPEKPGKE